MVAMVVVMVAVAIAAVEVVVVVRGMGEEMTRFSLRKQSKVLSKAWTRQLYRETLAYAAQFPDFAYL